MAFTVQQVLDLARLPLNDALKVRYNDTVLLSYYNVGVLHLYEIRPDLQIGNFGSVYVPVVAAALSSAFPLSDRFALPLADYIGGRAEMRDEDAATGGRGQALMKLFSEGVTA